MNMATRPLRVGLLAIWVLAILSALGVFAWMTHLAQRQSFVHLASAARVERALQSRQLAELRLRADHLAKDPAFVAYVAQSLIPDPARGNAIDSASIADLLSSRRQGYDLALVLDPGGKPAARSGDLLANDANLRNDPAIGRAIVTLKPQQELRVEQGQIILVVVEPLLRGEALQGVLYTAKQLGGAFTEAVSRVSGSEVLLLAMPAAASDASPANGGSSELAHAIQTALAATPGQSGSMTMRVDGRTLPAIATTLPTVGGQATLVALDPGFDAAVAAIKSAWPLWLGILLLASIASGGVLVRWRRTDLPLAHICAILERGVEGDRALVIRTHGSAALRRLRDQLNAIFAQASSDAQS